MLPWKMMMAPAADSMNAASATTIPAATARLQPVLAQLISGQTPTRNSYLNQHPVIPAPASTGWISRNRFDAGRNPHCSNKPQQCCLTRSWDRLSSVRKEPLPSALPTLLCPILRNRDHSILCRRPRNSAVASSRRDDPQRLLQAIDGVRNGATVGIGYHVPGVIYQMQI
jgi:hypothetical protein